MGGKDQQQLYEQGNEAYRAGAFARARDVWARILEDDPANFDALTSLMNAYHQMNDSSGPIPFFERAREAAPEDERITIYFVDALVANQEDQKAFHLANEALETHPDNSNLRVQVGRGWMGLGESEKARKELWAAIEIDPAIVIPIYYLARIGDERDLDQLDSLAAEAWQRRDTLEPSTRLMLAYAMGAIAEKQGRFDDAWSAYVAANDIHKNLVLFDEMGFVDVVTENLKHFGNAVPPPASNDAPGQNLIFIVSLPRSGSTLTEQILASHSRVKTIGERTLVHEAFQVWNEHRTPAALEEARNTYLTSARALANCADDDDPIIVDKSITNYISLGFLRMLFPGAKFVHVVRAPMDAALSCYATPFGLNALKWCSDFGSIARVFRRYQKLMKIWMRHDRGDLMTLTYEDLTADPDTKVRELIAFCGLEWEPACLDFHKSKRQVSTASVSQVRRPIYKSVQGRAAPFDEYLGPLKKVLGRAASPDWYRKI